MKLTLKLVSALLAGLMLCSTLVACGDKNENQTETSQANGVSEGDGFTLEKEDNGGKKITVLHNSDFATYDVVAESSADSVASAIFARDLTVEEYLGIDINYVVENGSWEKRAEFNQKIQASAQAGADYDYDVVCGYSSCSLIANSQMGCFKNMYDYNDIISYDKQWWLGSLDEYAINDTLYCVYGDLTLSTYKQLSAIFFNQALINNYDLTSPYEMVKNGTWTYEEMLKIALDIEENLDSNQEISYKSDLVGYIQHSTAARGWLTALDINLITKGADGSMTISETPSEKLINVYNKFYSAFNNNTNVYSGAEHEIYDSFTDGRALYMLSFIGYSDEFGFGAMEDDWGLVPLPKFNEAQEDYITPLGSSAGMWCIMTNSQSDTLCAKMMECMSYFSNKNVVDEYYVKTLGERRARDEQVMSMLEIIRNGSRLTFQIVYNNAFSPNMSNILQMDENWRSDSNVGASVSSYWGANYRAWRKNLQTLLTTETAA